MLPVLLIASITAADPASCPELAWLPPQTAAVLQVDAKHWWSSELASSVRELAEKAGKPALRSFESRFPIVPTNVERVTMFLLADGPENPTGFLVRTAKPIDDKKLAELFRRPRSQQPVMAYRRLDAHTFAAAEIPAVLEKFSSNAAPNLEGVSARVAELGQPLTMVIDLKRLPADSDIRQMAAAYRPLFDGETASLTARFDSGIRLEFGCVFPDVAKATAGEQTVRTAIADGRGKIREEIRAGEARLAAEPDPKQPPLNALVDFAGLIALHTADEHLERIQVVRDANSVRASSLLPITGDLLSSPLAPSIALALITPAVQKTRETAGRSVGMNNLKQIGLALHNYYDDRGLLPPWAIQSADGKPLLSWRVALLPFIEQDQLYGEFRLDEPWDSEHNRKLIAKMPIQYVSPLSPSVRELGLTHYRALVGRGAAWEFQPRGRKFTEITDSLSNTMFVVEATDAVIWTKPDELTYDPNKPLPGFGLTPNAPFTVLFGDGSVRTLPRSLPEATLRALITAQGGEVIPWDW